MSRITLEDTGLSALQKLTGGNPGAVSACCEMMNASPRVDPDSALGAAAPLLGLDQHRIYGPRIWMLYSDVCQRNVVWALALLRAVQLGLMSELQLNHAIDNRGDGVDVEAMVAAVKAQLPRFNATAEVLR